MAKHLFIAIKPNNTPGRVKLANGTVVCILAVSNGLVSSGVWQVYVILLVLDVLFKVIRGIPWLSCISTVGLGEKGASCTEKRVLGPDCLLF